MDISECPLESHQAVSGLRAVPRRLVVRLVHGDLTRRIADCFVINHYLGVQIAGAAKAVDQYLGGVLSRLAARGILDTQPGTVYFVPSEYAPLSADTIGVLSMGEYERFVTQDAAMPIAEQWVQQQLYQFGHSIAISCCDVGLRNVAMPVHGAGANTQISPVTAVRYLLAGYYQGVREYAEPGQTYFLTLTELDGDKIDSFRDGIERAIYAGQCGSLQPAGQLATRSVGVSEPWAWVADLDVMYRRVETEIPRHLRLGALMFAENKLKLTTIGTGSADQVVYDQYPEQAISDMRVAIEEIHEDMMTKLFKLERLQKAASGEEVAEMGERIAALHSEAETTLLRYGHYLFNQVFRSEDTGHLRQRLQAAPADTLLLRLDEATAGIPWELLAVEDRLFALTKSIGRQLELVGQVRQPPPRSDEQQGRLRVLIVANPTGDLPQVEEESRRIIDMLYALDEVEIQVTALFREEAMRQYVISLLNEQFDVFHYAGHASFDPASPSQSGLLLAGHDLFTANMMWTLARPPGLVFFNACESAATVESDDVLDTIRDGHYVSELPLGSISALLRAGTRNFVGTQWPVEDTVAAEMAIACYAELAAGASVGEALRRARGATIERIGYGHLSWASYVLYGSPWNRYLS